MGRVYLFRPDFDHDDIRETFFRLYPWEHCVHCKLESCCVFLPDLNDAVRLNG